MFTSPKCVVFGGIAASLLCTVAPAEPKAPIIWQPPAEIAGKPGAAAGAPSEPVAPAPVAATTDPKAAQQQNCADQAKAKGLKRGKKWAFISECMGGK